MLVEFLSFHALTVIERVFPREEEKRELGEEEIAKRSVDPE